MCAIVVNVAMTRTKHGNLMLSGIPFLKREIKQEDDTKTNVLAVAKPNAFLTL